MGSRAPTMLRMVVNDFTSAQGRFDVPRPERTDLACH